MKLLSLPLAALCFSLAVFSSFARAADVTTHCFELRIYHTHPGKLSALETRFREHTNKLLEKHGMRLVGFWTPVDADKGAGNTLIYIVEHPSREAAKANWEAFQKDPEWVKAKADSEKDGPLVINVDSTFMSPTDFSALQ